MKLFKELLPALLILAISLPGVFFGTSYLISNASAVPTPKFKVGQCFILNTQTTCEISKESWETCAPAAPGKILEVGKSNYHVVYFLADNSTAESTVSFQSAVVLVPAKCPKGFEE